MKYIIFDTETTDFYKEVLQLSYMVVDKDLEVEEFKSFYCDVNGEVSEGAFNVHHISNKMAHELSEGKYLEDYLFKDKSIQEAFFSTGRVYIGYNVNYDIKSMNYSLMPSGTGLPATRVTYDLRMLDENLVYHFDLMQKCRKVTGMIKGLTLGVATKKIVGDNIDIDEAYKHFCNKFGVTSSGTGYHDASYDVVCTYLVLLALSEELC